MPITKAAKKGLRQDKRRRARNIEKKDQLKSLLKEVKDLISQAKAEEAKKLLPKAYKLLDKAAKTNLIKKNTASRRKARLTKSTNQILKQNK